MCLGWGEAKNSKVNDVGVFGTHKEFIEEGQQDTTGIKLLHLYTVDPDLISGSTEFGFLSTSQHTKKSLPFIKRKLYTILDKKFKNISRKKHTL